MIYILNRIKFIIQNLKKINNLYNYLFNIILLIIIYLKIENINYLINIKKLKHININYNYYILKK